MKIAIAQINTTVGNISGNTEKILSAYHKAAGANADVVVLPELATVGYPPRDLLLRDNFIAQNLADLDRLKSATGETGLIVGFAGRNESQPGRIATNAVALLHRGRIVAQRAKTLLPTYDVFDEDRYFEPATENLPVEFKGVKLGLTICEDVWNDADFWRQKRYPRDPIADLLAAGSDIIFNISASPWHLGKNRLRHSMLASLAQKAQCPLIYCNLIGGNDELVFDGRSLAFDRRGRLTAQAAMFDEDFVVIDTETAEPVSPATVADEEKLYRALVLGLRDYFQKCGFKSAVLGLSGGIDSSLVACLAAAALGPENVRGISLPSQYSSQGSLDDARLLAERLNIRYEVVPIQPSFVAVKEQLKQLFAGLAEDITEENLQARLRGVILMALSNKFGSLLLSTGNKSELAVGYCTLYGDMCGGLAVISDVPKTMVYRMANWINHNQVIIPVSSITKPPSAELRPNQTDQDSLPPYDVLDAILDAYVVDGVSQPEIVSRGFDAAVVQKVIRLINSSEYKRRQAAPGLKVTSKAFGSGRRIPIAQRYRES